MTLKNCKKHEFYVSFEDEYYNIVRSIIDNFREHNLIGFANGKGIFNSGILVTEERNNITTIWFRLPKNKLNCDLCKKTIHDLEYHGIVKIKKES